MPEDRATVQVRSPIASMQISLVDSSFNEVASGTGDLAEGDLEPGVYELRFSAGPATSTRLINLRAGEEHREVADLSFPAAIPLLGTSTWSEKHEVAATRGSSHIAEVSRGPEDGGLLVMARHTVNDTGLPALSEIRLTRETAELGITELPTDEGQCWWNADGPDWTLTAGAIEPGPYCLHTQQGATPMRQSLWVAPGWQTLVFLPAGPDGIVASHATVAMTELAEPWSPANSRQTAQATELALAGLRERRTVLPADFLDLLLREKFADPMLGILGAHSMLLDPSLDFELFDVVIDNLNRLIPEMPDVAGLQVLGEEAREGAGLPVPENLGPLRLRWPPMLLLAYTALIRLDSKREGTVIVPGSPAETLAGRLMGDSIWTAWTAEKATVPQTRKRRRRAGLRSRESAVANALRAVEAPEPEIRRVANYLASVADIEGPEGFEQMLRGELGLAQNVAMATNVPLRSVQDAIDTIKELSEDI